ncbi:MULTISPECIES: DUF1566 domain-containing protein [Rheinheimera]|uniref:DUF1566 domain-containing protein n=1 Tax=Rheinheimera marina TaxID=1774958 RepID=A0ABV9JK40_9GAMM
MKFTLMLALSLSLPLQAAQICYSTIEDAIDFSQFTLNSDGTVLDSKTRLLWSACLVGQSWDSSSKSCTGNPQQLTWADALLESARQDLGGFSSWRLPNAKEVQSIINRGCVDPALRLSLFPGANSENIWTGTTAANEANQAFAVAMYSGKNNLKTKNAQLYVRLVRFSDE